MPFMVLELLTSKTRKISTHDDIGWLYTPVLKEQN